MTELAPIDFERASAYKRSWEPSNFEDWLRRMVAGFSESAKQKITSIERTKFADAVDQLIQAGNVLHAAEQMAFENLGDPAGARKKYEQSFLTSEEDTQISDYLKVNIWQILFSIFLFAFLSFSVYPKVQSRYLALIHYLVILVYVIWKFSLLFALKSHVTFIIYKTIDTVLLFAWWVLFNLNDLYYSISTLRETLRGGESHDRMVVRCLLTFGIIFYGLTMAWRWQSPLLLKLRRGAV